MLAQGNLLLMHVAGIEKKRQKSMTRQLTPQSPVSDFKSQARLSRTAFGGNQQQLSADSLHNSTQVFRPGDTFQRLLLGMAKFKDLGLQRNIKMLFFCFPT
ncbi:MAG: hypothetical protein VKO39_06805 [Cyanobacteriota bacterium]|nr:hypothetical protein [Cyanobacteriota bacterium]